MTPPGAAAGLGIAAAVAASVVAGGMFFGRRTFVACSALAAFGCGACFAAGVAFLKNDGGARLWAPAFAVGFFWCAALAGAGAVLRSVSRPGSAAAFVVCAAAISLSSPWWVVVDGSAIPSFAVRMNPWLLAIGTLGGVDWIRAPGVYPFVGAAYTSADAYGQTLFGWTAVAMSGGLSAAFIQTRRSPVSASRTRKS